MIDFIRRKQYDPKRMLTPVLLTLLATAFAGPGGTDSSTQGFAVQRIVNKLQINKVSDLNFGEASPGDSAKTVPPGSSENGENASFRVQGEAGRPFFLFLPQNGSVKMTLGNGGPDREIGVDQFQSSVGTQGLLDGNGQAMIFVGATRKALSNRLKSGDYIGSFTVTVIY